MAHTFVQKLIGLELEEKILNGALLITLLAFLCPWVSGTWLGDMPRSHGGFGFYTGIIGTIAFVLECLVFLIGMMPIFTGRSLVRRQHRDTVRFFTAATACVLITAALTVLMQATLVDFPGMNVRFGAYVALIGSLVVLLYTFLAYQAERRNQLKELFHHPEEVFVPRTQRVDAQSPPPPPPPPPPAIEDHPLHAL